jgi:hypothetical protein
MDSERERFQAEIERRIALVHDLDALEVELQAERLRCDKLHAALDMLWVHYLLVISDEQKNQVREALAATTQARIAAEEQA